MMKFCDLWGSSWGGFSVFPTQKTVEPQGFAVRCGAVGAVGQHTHPIYTEIKNKKQRKTNALARKENFVFTPTTPTRRKNR